MIRKTVFTILFFGCIGCSEIDTAKFRVSGLNRDSQRRIIFVVDGQNVGSVVEPGDTQSPHDIKVVFDKPLWYGLGPSSIKTADISLGVRDADTQVVFMDVIRCQLAQDSVTNFVYSRDGGVDRLYCR
ncbi:MAG: hypothetical protein WAX44_04080 [Minisyncoccia bacterium]